MKVGVIGSGGREHAICISLQKSKNIEKIYCFPGNAGTSFIAENIEIELNKKWWRDKRWNLIITKGLFKHLRVDDRGY